LCYRPGKKLAGLLGLPVNVIPCTPTNPAVLITWAGKDPSLPSVLLNSHTDVVPVYPEFWSTKDPFIPEINDQGDIIARGTQDMKCVGTQLSVTSSGSNAGESAA
jgi:aminoacylase